MGRIFSYLERRRFYMKTSRFSDARSSPSVKQAEFGSPVPELCRVSMGSGAPNSVAWMPLSWRASKIWKRKNLKKMYAEERKG